MSEKFKHPSLEKIENPTVEPLTLADLKIYLRIDGSSEDSILTSMLSASREMAEQYMRNSIIKQKHRLTYYGLIPTLVLLPKGPVSEIVSVKLFDSEGSSATLSSQQYYLSSKMQLNLNKSHSAHRIEVDYYAGFSEDTTDVPEIIKQGLLSQIAHMYEHRGTGRAGVDESAKSLFNFFKNYYL